MSLVKGPLIRLISIDSSSHDTFRPEALLIALNVTKPSCL